MRVGILALLHESNTFVTRPTTIDDFQREWLIEGDAVRKQLAEGHHEISGFFAGIEKANARRATQGREPIEAVPLFAARALPSGPIAEDAWSELLERMFAQLAAAGPLDGLLVAPHGAAVSETFPDADGHWLSELRNRVGKETPIIGTIDLHANLSRTMVQSCDALIAYRSNPHLDQRERGIEAAGLMARTLEGQIRPTMAAVFPPMAINIERQMTEEPPLAECYNVADRQLGRETVLSSSIVLGFPYADVEEMGTSIVVVTDDAPELADRLAGELADCLWTRRHDFVGRFVGIKTALDECTRLDGPVCLLDMGDNVGGGSPADGTIIAHEIHKRRLPRSFVCVYDPDAVRQAEQAGIGQTVSLRIGGKTDAHHGQPLATTLHVRSMHDGRFQEQQVRHGGLASFDQGRTVVVDTDYGMTVMLTSRRMVPFSLEQLKSCGLDPSEFKILVAKGVHAPVAAYREVARHFIRVNTPGSTCADMTRLDFRHRRRPLFPFESQAEWRRRISD